LLIEARTLGEDFVYLETDSTICAIAAGSEGALRGVIRISGPLTLDVLKRLFPELAVEFGAQRGARRYEGALRLERLGTVLVGVYYWPDARSYTGQPSAEFHLIGSPVVMEEVQQVLFHSGVRMAQPGEFTLRAFLAGRMDLTQCEAVFGLIHAQGERAFQVALQQLAGGLATPLKQLRKELIELLADLEAGLDFVDEDIEFVERSEVLERLDRAEREVQVLVDQIEQRRGQSVEFQVVLIGAPNAGKSSLINAIAQRDVSIISPEPGTTRDYVRTRLDLGNNRVDLLDTAGLEFTEVASPYQEATPGSIAQQKTWEQLRDADLVLLCVPYEFDGEENGTKLQLEERLSRELTGKRVWGIRTKLDQEIGEQCLVQGGELGVREHSWPISIERSFAVCSLDRRGIDALVAAIEQTAGDWRGESMDVVPLTGVRCRSALVRGLESLGIARQAAEEGLGEEIVAGELRVALEELGQVAGTVANNDILDALFSRFCIGK
jgi:tRNA modification GTPase